MQTTSLDQTLRVGIDKIKQANYADGEPMLRHVISIHPKNAEAWLWLGWSAFWKGETRTAQRCFLQAERFGHPQAKQALEATDHSPIRAQRPSATLTSSSTTPPESNISRVPGKTKIAIAILGILFTFGICMAALAGFMFVSHSPSASSRPTAAPPESPKSASAPTAQPSVEPRVFKMTDGSPSPFPISIIATGVDSSRFGDSSSTSGWTRRSLYFVLVNLNDRSVKSERIDILDVWVETKEGQIYREDVRLMLTCLSHSFEATTIDLASLQKEKGEQCIREWSGDLPSYLPLWSGVIDMKYASAATPTRLVLKTQKGELFIDLQQTYPTYSFDRHVKPMSGFFRVEQTPNPNVDLRIDLTCLEQDKQIFDGRPGFRFVARNKNLYGSEKLSFSVVPAVSNYEIVTYTRYDGGWDNLYFSFHPDGWKNPYEITLDPGQTQSYYVDSGLFYETGGRKVNQNHPGHSYIFVPGDASWQMHDITYCNR